MAAASVAVGGGLVGIAISGAGAVAENVILTKTDAYIADSKVTSQGGDVSINAASTSAITATVVAASVAIGGGGYAGVAASIGVAIAKNFIGWQADGTPASAEVRAFVQRSTISAGGDLNISAIAGEQISALVFAGSVAIGAAAGLGLSASGSGLSVDNRIATLVQAAIDGDHTAGIAATGISAHHVSVTALDTSTITAFAGAVSIAASVAGAGAVAFSIGVSLAHNEIGTRVEAFIAHAVTGVTSTVGAIVLMATEGATINAISIAASAAVAVAILGGLALSGAGADSTNVILTRTNAYIADSNITSAGDVTVTATNTSAIHALVLAISIAVGGGVGVGVGASIGVALARNLIGWDPNAYDYTSTMVLSTGLAVGKRVLVITGDGAGNLYEYKGLALPGTVNLAGQNYGDTSKWTWLNASDHSSDEVLSGGLAQGTTVRITTGVGAGDVYQFVGAARSGSVDLRREQYSDVSQWKQLNLAARGAEVQAYVLRSSITATTGDLKLNATSTQTIDSLVVAGSAAVAAGLLGIGISGAGVGVVNKINVHVKAYIDGDGATGITAQRVSLIADDASTITATAGAVSIAAAFGGVAGGISIAIAVAYNEISNDVVASIANAIHHVTSTVGAIALSATSQGRRLFTLTTLTAAQLDDAGTVDTGAGAAADATGDAALKSTLSSAFTTALEPLSGTITVTILDPGIAWQVTTSNGGNYLIQLIGGVLKVTAPTSIQAISAAASIAVAVGLLGGAVSGAGVVATNVILTKTDATIADSVISSATDVTLDATDTALIRAKIITAAAGVGVGIGGIGASIGVAIARNFIGYRADGTAQTAEVHASIDRSSVTAGGKLTLQALSNQTIEALVVAGSVAIAGGLYGFAAAGAGATTTNQIAANVKATINGDGTAATGITAGSIRLSARDTSKITANTASVAVAASIAPDGAAIAIAVATANNSIGNTIEASIKNADTLVKATTGGIVLDAYETASITALTIAGAFAFSFSGSFSGGGAQATNTTTTATKAYIGASPKVESNLAVKLTADDHSSISATLPVISASFGLIGGAGAGSVTTNTIGALVDAYIDHSKVTVTAGNVEITATSQATVTADTLTIASPSPSASPAAPAPRRPP